ncbi:MAG: hypothetical protein HUU38_14445 [Anaerolineales bacterium]|nr:hypothetical protein [Anaerolineales bacterium]
MFQPISRVVIALIIFLSGIALMPFIALPTEAFQWQKYADVYEEPEIVVNYYDGQPGSFFHFQGIGFTPNSSVDLMSNNLSLGSIITDGAGNLEFQIDSTNAEIGSYYISVLDGNISLTTRIMLNVNSPVRPQEGAGEIFLLPAGSGLSEIFLPTITR